MVDKLEGPDGLIELTVPLEAKMNLGIVTDFDADKLDREKWLLKYGYKPYRAMMSDEAFFDSLNMAAENLVEAAKTISTGDLLRTKASLLNTFCADVRCPAWRMQEPVSPDRETVLKQVEPYMNGEPFPLDRDAFPSQLAAAYEATGETSYLRKWLDIFDVWVRTNRPPAGVPTVFIACHFIGIPWGTLTSMHRLEHMIQVENLLRARGPEFGEGDQRINLYKSLIEHGRFLASMNTVFHPNNWQVSEMYVLLDMSIRFPEFRESSAWSQLAIRRLGEHIRRETLPDGAYHERCTGYNTAVMRIFREALERMRRGGLEPPKGLVENLRKTCRHHVHFYAPGLVQPGIGDAKNTGPNAGLDLMIDGALSFRIPECKWFAERDPQRVRRAAEMLYGDGADEALARYEELEAKKPDKTSALLPDAGWAVMRSSWEDDALYMITDYGSNVPWHTHPDFLGFSIFAHGRPLITDVGTGGTQGYQSEVSKKWCKQTIGHNTVLVDRMSQEKFHEGACHRWVASGGFDYLRASHPGYRFLGVEHERRILFVKP
ncbi:MAG: alginate lyase family protein, partial [Candidatus Latescibacteria bacterium]|nr:alginate lyase family protein [Candidatus Latescibacterota bacterium]